jgi:hypothetical protein
LFSYLCSYNLVGSVTVMEAEERVSVGTVAVDVDERSDALIKQLEYDDCHGARTFSILPLVSSFFCAFV